MSSEAGSLCLCVCLSGVGTSLLNGEGKKKNVYLVFRFKAAVNDDGFDDSMENWACVQDVIHQKNSGRQING